MADAGGLEIVDRPFEPQSGFTQGSLRNLHVDLDHCQSRRVLLLPKRNRSTPQAQEAIKYCVQAALNEEVWNYRDTP